jgi:hypothetical protein
MHWACLRDRLADEREAVAAHAARRCAEMASRLAAHHLSSMRPRVNAASIAGAELRYIDGIVTQRERRFAALWSARA